MLVVMATWTCPKCKRQFGKSGQGHMCAPGLTLEEFFDSAQPWEEPIFNVINDHLTSLPASEDLIIDPIAMGIQIKNGPVVCQLRSMKKWTALGFTLRRQVTSKRLSRKVSEFAGKYYHVINVSDAAQIDEEILEWVTEAFYTPVGGPPSDVDPMVPDDIDDEFGELL